MARRLLDSIGKLATRHPWRVVGVFVGLALLSALLIPSIKVDPAPEKLVDAVKQARDLEGQRVFESFGKEAKPLLLLVETPDGVFSADALIGIDRLTRSFEKEEWVKEVLSISNAPIPRDRLSIDETPDKELLDLDALEEDTVDSDDSDTLDPVMTNALVDLMQAYPERFEPTVGAVGSRLRSELRTTPFMDAPGMNDRVPTPEQADEIRASVGSSSFLRGTLVGRDGASTLVVLSLEDTSAKGFSVAVKRAQELLEETDLPFEVALGGLPHLRSEITSNIRRDNAILTPFMLLICMFLLFFAFRWFPAVWIPIVAVAFSALYIVGAMVAVGESLNVLNNIVPALLIVIGVSDSIHLISRYLDEKGPCDEAMRRTVVAMGAACFLTSVTTAVGLGSLVVSQSVMLRHFGLVAAAGILIAYAVTIMLVPGLIVATSNSRPQAEKGNLSIAKWVESITRWVVARAWLVVAFSSVLLAAILFYSYKTVKVDHGILDQFDPSSSVYATTKKLEDSFSGIQPLHVLVKAKDAKTLRANDANALLGFERWVKKQDGVISSMSYPSMLLALLKNIDLENDQASETLLKNDQAYQALDKLAAVRASTTRSAYISDSGWYRVDVYLRDIGANRIIQFIEDAEQELRKSGLATVRMAGPAYTSSRGQKMVVSDLLSSLAAASVVIFLIVAFLFRSPRLGLLSIPPNLLPVAATMFYLAWRGFPLNVGNVIVFSIALGLAVDGSIHLFARFQEESRSDASRSLEEALVSAARGTGKAIVITCFVLTSGFAALLLSGFVPVRRFGELIGISVLGCLVGTLVVQPALLYLFSGQGEPR